MGGAERQMAGLATMLCKAGHEVELICYRSGSFYLPCLLEAGVRCVRLGGPQEDCGGAVPRPCGSSDRAIVRALVAELKAFGCEVLISFLAGTNVKACLAHRLYPHFRLVVSERNANSRLLPHDLLRFALYREASAVVCNSHTQEEFVRSRCKWLRSRLHCIPNFVDTERFSPAAECSFSETDCHGTGAEAGSTAEHCPATDAGLNSTGTGCSSPLRIVTTARICKRKNAAGLLKAAALCSEGAEIHFEWYGTGAEGRYASECSRLRGALGLDASFVFHPEVRKVEQCYRSADAFCLPSFYEGTSNSLAEALSCGLPVICSDVSDASLYVRDGVNGFLFNPHDTASIARALRRFASLTTGQRHSFGAESRRVALDNFAPDIFIGRYLDLLGSLVLR